MASPSVSSTINSGSDGSDRPFPRRHVRAPSYESDDGNDGRFSLIIHRTADEIQEFVKEQRLLRANQGDAVSNSISPDSSFSHGNSASEDSQGEDMTEEEFFAQFGEAVPDWARQPLDAAPQDQGDGDGGDLMELDDDDIAAQLSAEITAVPDSDDDDIIELSAEDFEAQRSDRTAANSDEEAREAQLDAEIGAEPVVDLAALAEKKRAIRRRRKARKDRYRKRRAPGKEARRSAYKTWSATKYEAQEIQLDHGDSLTEPTTEELLAALDAELAGDDLTDLTTEGLEAELDAEIAGDDLADLTTADLEAQLDAELAEETSAAGAVDGASNSSKGAFSETWAGPPTTFDRPTVTAVLEIRAEKLARKRASNKHGPLRQRLGKNKPPPMRSTERLPKAYHHQNPIDWTPLRQAITLSTYFPFITSAPSYLSGIALANDRLLRHPGRPQHMLQGARPRPRPREGSLRRPQGVPARPRQLRQPHKREAQRRQKDHGHYCPQAPGQRGLGHEVLQPALPDVRVQVHPL